MEAAWALKALAAGGVLVYGTLHGALVVWVWKHRESLMIPTLLFISPIGVAVAVLAAMPFIGLVAGLTVLAALAVGFAPIGLIVGYAALNRREDGLR